MKFVTIRKGDKNKLVGIAQRLLKLKVDNIFGPLTEEAVREFQEANHLVVDGIIGVKTWTRLLGYLLLPSKRVITEIIVHCTATPAGKDFTVDDIRRWHKAQGWSDIGYHYVVDRYGIIHDGRDVDIAGAHCKGHNTHSIGVCYIGGMTKDGSKPADTRTVAQAQSMRQLLISLHQLYPGAKIHGHRDFAAKACPSFDATKEYKTI